MQLEPGFRRRPFRRGSSLHPCLPTIAAVGPGLLGQFPACLGLGPTPVAPGRGAAESRVSRVAAP
eukprot:1467920-Alexandrium_andersonii.AAC.1